MGFKQAAVLAPVSFFLGVLFICFNVDHRILWGGVAEDVISDGLHFYTTFFNAPPAIKALLHGMIGVGLIGLLSKLHKWDDSAMFFDGSSLAAYIFGVALYLTVTLNSLRTIADPIKDVDTRDDQVNAMKVLSAGNVMIIGSLCLILCLQGGQEWIVRYEAKEIAEWEREQRTNDISEKKDQ